MSPASLRSSQSTPRFPRVSGDEPGHANPGRVERLFSPRERG